MPKIPTLGRRPLLDLFPIITIARHVVTIVAVVCPVAIHNAEMDFWWEQVMVELPLSTQSWNFWQKTKLSSCLATKSWNLRFSSAVGLAGKIMVE
jgi:hypothetical protein